MVFIAVHLAPYLKDVSTNYPAVGAPVVATTALALIGLFNIFGTYGSGILAQRFPKRYLLSAIYIGRSIAITAFLLLPPSPMSTYIFLRSWVSYGYPPSPLPTVSLRRYLALSI